jgi:hypothetical protein
MSRQRKGTLQAMSRQRKGTLSDAQTLGMYEDGVSIVALAVHENLTAYGVITRLSRQRARARRNASALRKRRVTRQATYSTFDALHAAVRDLERTLRTYDKETV